MNKNRNIIRINSLLILTFLGIIFNNYLSKSQVLSNPLEPAFQFINKNYVGGFIGFGNNFQNGKYLVNCQGCEFSGGNGLNVIVGVNRDWGLQSKLYFGVGLAYESMALNSTFREFETLEDKQNGIFFDAEFRHRSKINLGLMRLMPYIRYEFLKPAFVKVGLSPGLIVSNSLVHTQAPVQEFVYISQLNKVQRLSLDEVELQNSKVNNLNTFQMGLNFETGLFFTVKKKTKISGSLQYYFPLTNIVNDNNNFNMSTLRFLVEIGFKTNKAEGDSMREVED